MTEETGQEVKLSADVTIGSAKIVALLDIQMNMNIFRILEEKDNELSVMYYGAIRVLEDRDNLDRIPQSAHSFRELMEKFPMWYDVSMEDRNINREQGLNNKINNVIERYKKTCKNTRCIIEAGSWSGEIDVHLNKFLKKFDEFKISYKKHYTSRRELFRQLLKRRKIVDSSMSEKTGKKISDDLYEAWDDLSRDFQSVAHHNKTDEIDEGDFRRQIEKLDILLLQIIDFRPDDRQEIDSLIKGEV